MNFSSALITGGTGLLGRALCRHLVQAGIETTILTRSGNQGGQGFTAISIPRLTRDTLLQQLGSRQFDVVFHLAAYGVAPVDRDPRVMFDANIAGTDAAIHAAAAVGARALVYIGSCSEYAPPEPGTLIGEDAPLTYSGLYGSSKAAAGLWGQALAQSLGVSFQWMRLFNVFGPGESGHRLIPSLIRDLRSGSPVPLSPGEQVRDFLFIDDVADGLALAAEAAVAGRTGPFNLCSGHPISVRDIALATAEAMSKPKDLLNFGALDYRPGECLWLVGNAARFIQETGFQPRVSLCDGILAMIAEGT